ncbi:MAG: helix-turn-helix transcriptional regulator [Methyloglobulus sp.]|nr:helix-turn-helix transcriptional regulator [Methyloglobulus sp.]
MLTLAKKSENYFRDYVRGGGKENRKRQVSRIVEFLDWVESTEKVISLHGLGKRHVIGFWKAHRHFSDETAYKYWLGIAKLWQWIGKHEEPPAPHKVQTFQKSVLNDTVFTEILTAIKCARESKNLSIPQLANMTGLEINLIADIENGKPDFVFADLLKIIEFLKIEILLKTEE